MLHVEKPYQRRARRLLSRMQIAEFVEFSTKAMPKRTFRPQVVEQSVCFFERPGVQSFVFEKLTETTFNLGFCQQGCFSHKVGQAYKLGMYSRGTSDACNAISRPRWWIKIGRSLAVGSRLHRSSYESDPPCAAR